MRDRIIHYYFGVSYDVLWRTIKDKLPGLKTTIERMIEEIEKG